MASQQKRQKRKERRTKKFFPASFSVPEIPMIGFNFSWNDDFDEMIPVSLRFELRLEIISSNEN